MHADVAQLVAHHLAKVRVAGSNPVIRSKVQRHQPQRWSGRVVRQRPAKPCTRVRFPSPPPSSNPGAISSAGERFPDTEEVTGSIPVSRTRVYAGQARFRPGLLHFMPDTCQMALARSPEKRSDRHALADRTISPVERRSILGRPPSPAAPARRNPDFPLP